MDPEDENGLRQHQYIPLEANAFRVLEILCLEPTISIRLIECREDDPPEYHALSYAWGLEENTEAITCDKGVLPVIPHLRDGLRCVCTSTGYRTLWVDAICINQKDDEEKAMQVSNMHHIFSRAKSVVVWLGADREDSDLAMAAMEVVKDNSILDRTVNLKDVLVRIKSTTTKIFNLPMFEPLANLADRAWFRRLWIAQEYFFAHSALFVCGMKVLDDTAFVKILRKLSIHSFHGQEPPNYRDYPNLFKGFRMLLDIQKLKEDYLHQNRPGFFDIVMLGRSREAKEPVDRIYAAFGMAEGADVIYRKRISIDYSKENRKAYWNVYSLFGKVALLHESHLRLLSVTSSLDRPELLPSWCPNLNSLSATSKLEEIYASGWPFKDHSINDQNSLTTQTQTCRWGHPNFKMKTVSHVQVSDSSDIISIWGASIGGICRINRTGKWNVNFSTDHLLSAQPFAKDLLAWLDSCSKICLDTLKDQELADWTFSEILAGARNEDQKRTIPEPSQGRYVRNILFLTVILHQILDLKPEHASQDQNPMLYEDFEAVLAWIVLIHRKWNNRALFATDSGMLGFASNDIKEHDLVCMLYSGRTMYVLRPQEEASKPYSFVSDAYVFDCMDGEVFDLLDKGVVREELFTIV
jgi:Heterokaryon incompatibility protein (HET)